MIPKIPSNPEGASPASRRGARCFLLLFLFFVFAPGLAQAAPSLSLDDNEIAENEAVGAVVGTFSSDAGTPNYELVAGDGTNDKDNGRFAITSAELKAAETFNFEGADSEKGPFSIRVKVTDTAETADNVTEMNFMITVTNVDDPLGFGVGGLVRPPSEIVWPEHTEGILTTFQATDEDLTGQAQTITYKIIAGDSGSAFKIDRASGELSVNDVAQIDYETTPNYSLTIEAASDESGTPGTTVTSDLAVTIQNLKPKLTTKSFSVISGAGVGSVLGTLEAVNPDGGTLEYEFVSLKIGGGTNTEALEVDKASGVVTFKTDPDQLFGDVDLDNLPEVTLNVRLAAVGSGETIDSAEAQVPITLQLLPGGSPILFDVLSGTGLDPDSKASPAKGDPVQSITTGPNGEIIVVGMSTMKGSSEKRAYLKIYPSGLDDPIVHVFSDPKFIPSSVVAGEAGVFVGGQLGYHSVDSLFKIYDENDDLIPVSGADDEPADTKLAVVYKVGLDGSLNGTQHPFYGGHDSMINDMELVGDRLYVCGGRRSTLVGSASPWPLTYGAIWASLSTVTLGWVDNPSLLDGNLPGTKTGGNFGWRESNMHSRAYYGAYTAIAVNPNGEVVLGGYILSDKQARDDGGYYDYGNAFMVRFVPDASGQYDNNSGENRWLANTTENFSSTVDGILLHRYHRIKDLRFVDTGSNLKLFMLMSYRYNQNLPFGDTDYVGGSVKKNVLKVARIDPAFATNSKVASDAAYIYPEAEVDQIYDDSGNLIVNELRAGSLAADGQGNIYVTGSIPGGQVNFGAANEISRPFPRFFAASYSNDLQSLRWVSILDEGAYVPEFKPSAYKPTKSTSNPPLLDFPTTPGNPDFGPMLGVWHPQRNTLVAAGTFVGGDLVLRNEGDSNSVSVESGKKGGFLTLLDREGNFVGSSGLVIESVTETDGRTVGTDALIQPFLGIQPATAGETYTVEVPKIIYQDKDGKYLGTFDSPPTEQQIKDEAVTRYVNTGFTVGDTFLGSGSQGAFTSTNNSYTFTFESDTRIVFFWKVDHALVVDSDLTGTGALKDGDDWTIGDGSDGSIAGLGLTTTAAGNPSPAVQKHWVPENDIVTAFIDGIVADPAKFGTRYLVDRWQGTGSAAGVSRTGPISPSPRQQVPQFVMDGPAELTYAWRIQHRVQVSTSNSVAKDAPQVRVNLSASPTSESNGSGSGEHWFDHGSNLYIGSLESAAGSKELTGWVYASSPFDPDSNPNAKTGGVIEGLEKAGTFYYLNENPFEDPVQVAWNYNDTIYRVSTAIGSRVDLEGLADLPKNDIKSDGSFIQPTVTVVDSPPGSNSTDMQQWDRVARQALPLRPGKFFLEWPKPGTTSDKIIVEVTSEFPGEAHFTQLYAPDLPPIELDPDPGDAVAFIEQKFTEGDAQSVEGAFTSTVGGRSVLLFSRADGAEATQTGAAVGDLNSETLQVKVVGTKVWQDKAAADLPPPAAGEFQSVAGIDMTEDAEIGSPLTSDFDVAGIGTGFVVYPLARYNANIHDRSRVADAGPVIPVNRQFEGVNDAGVNLHDLIVFWYDRSADTNGILWPTKVVEYTPQWPQRHDPAAAVQPPLDGDYLRRIVVASRLGSEGKDRARRNQLSFNANRFSNVRVYQQANKAQAGYNPNEEHALVAPSFRLLGQANAPLTAYALRNDLNIITQGADYTSDPYVLVEFFDQEAGEDGGYRMAVYEIQYDDPLVPPDPPDANDRVFPYVFNYPMKAGEPVQPPYPLGLVIGFTPCEQTFGFDLGPQRTYWEDHKGQPWAVSDGSLGAVFYYPQALDFWNGNTPPGTCLPFVPHASLSGMVDATVPNPVFTVGSQFFIGEHPVVLTGTTPTKFVEDFNAVTSALDASDDLSNLSAEIYEITLRISHANQGDFVLRDGPGRPLASAGILGSKSHVTYRVEWPDKTPVLKAGETLTYPGGEYKADKPDAPGLPGVIGWAAGTVVYDSLNPTMDSRNAFNNPDQYSARLIAPLETLIVPLELSSDERAQLSPATGLTRADGTLWRFPGLSASLQRRLFYDPLGDQLGIKGFVNDKTLGDSSLTAAPAPVYVLEPNILTPREKLELDQLEGLSGLPSWHNSVEALFNVGRDPKELGAGSGYFAGLENDTASGGKFVGRDILTEADDDSSLNGRYFLLYHPDKPVWVWLQVAGTAEFEGKVAVARDDNFSMGDIAWDSNQWLGDGGQVTHEVQFTSGALATQNFDIVGNNSSNVELATGGSSLGIMGLATEDEFQILRKADSTLQPPAMGGFESIRVIISAKNRKATDVAGDIAAEISAANKGYAAAATGNRIQLTYQGGPAAPRDANTGFTFEEVLDGAGASNSPVAMTAVPDTLLGPGLALVPGPQVLDPASAFTEGYVTIVENNDPDLGGPVSLFIVKVSKEHRYRGAIKTILTDNVFEERVTLRHTGDFGGNADDIVYQWFYREEDGTETPLPPNAAWKVFPDQSDNTIKGLAQYQIDLEGTGGLLLADNLFFLRYRHVNDVPAAGVNSVKWGPADSVPGLGEGDFTAWWNDGQPPVGETTGELFAGAGNSPSVDGDYKPQLVQGWIKRVLDRINPYEARFDDFRNNEVPATYVSMIQQAGTPYLGPVALNPNKNVIENVGLLELYHTIFDRGKALSIDLSSPINTPGVNNALLLASSRLSDLYMLLGNEAYSDAVDPTIGFGSNSSEYGHASPSIFSFQNQMGTLLDEELSLLRGVDESFARPVFNRLFWNFTKNEGEAAYAVNYGISDRNLDGFIDESDAMILFPQGHGDAWGHYLSALRQQYQLLRNPFFNWVSRSEQYNLLDIVISVDFEDERKFASAAAAKARAGADVVQQTYRSRYVTDPDGQWQGYVDPDEDRSWGVQGWARRAGQGAYFDWVTANAILPDEDEKNRGVVNEALKKIDRKTVTAIGQISGYHGQIQSTYDDANEGLNPLGLSDEVVPFDIDPNFDVPGTTVQSLTHFEQIYQRAEKAAVNALRVFDAANANGSRLRQQQVTADKFFEQTYQQDQTFRNGLIKIFGTPYEGTIGTGMIYPAGYNGPDINLWFYVDVPEVTDATIPEASGNFQAAVGSFASALKKVSDNKLYLFGRTSDSGVFGPVKNSQYPFFVPDVFTAGQVPSAQTIEDAFIGMTPADEDGNVVMNFPLSSGDYTFKAPDGWGRRSAPGELQNIISQVLIAEAELALAQGDYDNYIKELEDMAYLLEAKSGLDKSLMTLRADQIGQVIGLNTVIEGLKLTATIVAEKSETFSEYLDDAGDALKITIGASTNVAGVAGKAASDIFKITQKTTLSGPVAGLNSAASVLEASKQPIELGFDLEVQKRELGYEIQQQIKEIEQHLRNEVTTRIAMFAKLEKLRALSDQYWAALQRGLALLKEREDFNKFTAATTQQTRYQDMAFRTFRNNVLTKYQDAFDLAARYAYLAAKAYDYDTNLNPDEPYSAQALLDDVIKARHLGIWSGNEPQVGPGLAGVLALMRDNFAVHKTQFGLNNFQQESSKLSLRQGHFRNKKNQEAGTADGAISNGIWRQVLQEGRKANLWEVPEFRQYCRPPQAESQGALPGIVLEFPTEIIFGNNVFGWPLGGGDFSYDPTNFATKIRAAGIWFEGYNNAALAVSPRVYLVPAGSDIMTIPNSNELEARVWNVVDQSIPPPFLTGDADIQNPDFIPTIDSLDGPFAEIRKFSSFRAYGDTVGTPPDQDQMTFDSRLVGRSVWNTKWLLIIPGGTLLNDGDEGLDRFINDVSDIKLFFNTLGYSGN